MPVTVVNNSPSPVMLKDGTVIGAAYTREARREGVTLHEEDEQRYVRPDCLVVVEEPAARAASPAPAVKQSTDTSAVKPDAGRRDSK